MATLKAWQASPKVAVVILNWNGRDDTLACLESVQKIQYPSLDVIVVDNGSEDGSIDAIRARYPFATVLEAGRNLGFAMGCNLGMQHALRRDAAFVFLLNNDAIVAPDIVDVFVDAATRFADAGALSPKIYYFSDPDRISYAGARWLDRKGYFIHLGMNTVDNGVDFQTVQESDYTPGCAMFFPAKMLDAIGPLEARFFLLFEEIDWCFRLKKAGYRCLFVPRAKVWHKGSVSFGGRDSPLYQYFFFRNRLLWAERHLPFRARLTVWAQTAKEMLPYWDHSANDSVAPIKILYWKARTWIRVLYSRWTTPTHRAMRRGLRDYLLRRFGDCPSEMRALAPTARPICEQSPALTNRRPMEGVRKWSP